MTKILQGIVQGRTIQLDGDPGIEDGRQVEVILRTRRVPGPPPGWEAGGTDTAAGMSAASWTEEDDRRLNEIHLERKRSTELTK